MTETRDSTGNNSDPAASVDSEKVATRAELLPEELAVGSDDPEAQAAAILLESEERTSDPNAGI